MKSRDMNLTPDERKWLPWRGANGKLSLGWSCFVNTSRYPAVERTFQSIADARVQALTTWAMEQWQFLQKLADEVADAWPPTKAHDMLELRRGHAPDFSELFLVDVSGQLLASSHPDRKGAVSGVNPNALKSGIAERFLHGPYVDPVTLPLGPSTSRFHDAVTVMFYQPVQHADQALGCLCGRVPNDVLGDLIQREAGHVYPESGDNYLFMVDSRFDPSIAQGIALSRSRFEDDTFSFGENLKGGVRTDWGTVTVQRHTEFEVRFTDPATKELHPGVRETITKGANLFVEYPGYSDYRHIPVIGSGVTLQLPGSPDTWGMMCEGDLEEVYRSRSLDYQVLTGMIPAVFLPPTIMLALGLIGMPAPLSILPAMLTAIVCMVWFYRKVPKIFADRLQVMSGIMLDVAECGASLSTRLDTSRMGNDETTQISRWINNLLDKLEGIVKKNTSETEKAREAESAAEMSRQQTEDARKGMLQAAAVIDGVAKRLSFSSEQLAAQVEQASRGAEEQKNRTGETATAMEEMNATVLEVAKNASQAAEASDQARTKAVDGATVVSASVEAINTVQAKAQEMKSNLDQLGRQAEQIGKIMTVIEDIADQTNLLALNAAIEAARAGDAGRGFAVVADEVRKLAEKTMHATKEVGEAIAAIQQGTQANIQGMDQSVGAIEEATRLVNQSGDALREILALAEQAADQVRSIATAAEQQSATSEEINRGVEDINRISTETSEVMDQSAQAISELARQAGELKELVAQLK